MSCLIGEKGCFFWNICRRLFNVWHVNMQDLLLKYYAAFLNYRPLLEDCLGISCNGFARSQGIISRVS